MWNKKIIFNQKTMTTINTQLIEKILKVNDVLIKFSQNHIFSGTDITPTQFNILWEIILHHWLFVYELKEKLIISAPALSQILNRMEKSWLIERKLGKTDKREITLSPTSKAKKLYQELNEKYILLAEQKLWNIKDKDKEIMIKFLDYVENTI